jgi:predicted Zn-dependent protease with MMP-like domain
MGSSFTMAWEKQLGEPLSDVKRLLAAERAERSAPSLSEIEALAERALAAIPFRLRGPLRGLTIRVEEFPDRETQRAMRLESPFAILGLYRGVALPHKSVSDPFPRFDMIFLYRQPILAYRRASGEDLFQLVRHVLIHEIGHHFGFSDEEMARIEASG